MSIYRNILIQAWQVTWQNKYLWFFGLFAALLLGNGGEVMVNFLDFGANRASFAGFSRLASTGLLSRNAFHNMAEIAKNDTVSFFIAILLLLVAIILSAFLVWLSVSSQAALVTNSAGHLSGKKGDFRSGILAGLKSFWPVLGFNIFLKIITVLSIALITQPLVSLMARMGAAESALFYIITFVVLLMVVLAASFIVKYAIAFSVLKGASWLESLKKGWDLFWKNWLVSIEMAITLFFISGLASVAYFVVITTLAVPFLIVGYVAANIGTVAVGFVLVAAIIFYFASLLVLGGLIATFQVTTWVNLFNQLINKGVTSKIIRSVEAWRS